MAESFAIRQSKTILARSCEAGRAMAAHRKSDRHRDDLYAGGLRKRVVS